MNLKNKILIVGLLSATIVNAEVNTILPYSAYLDYDSKSSKKSGNINGFYFSRGDLSYLTEINYAHTDIKYKQQSEHLKQDELTFVYNKYKLKYAVKAGIHINSTSDKDLQNGNTVILGLNSWKYIGYNKLSYGFDFYSSIYKNGKDLNNNSATVRVDQITPFISYFKYYTNFSNFISLKGNFEQIGAYSNEKTYSSYELKDTIYYKQTYFELGYFSGTMRTGIKDNGMTVYNSRDKITQIINTKVGYYINKNLNTSLSYSTSKFDEFNGQKDTKSNAVIATISYTF